MYSVQYQQSSAVVLSSQSTFLRKWSIYSRDSFWNPVNKETLLQVRWETIDKFPNSRLQRLRYAKTEGKYPVLLLFILGEL